jgi:hypothetical protein
MTHANPSRDLAVVVEGAIDLLLEKLERKRLARTKSTILQSRTKTQTLRAVGGTRAGEPIGVAERSAVSRAVRREVFERDGARCTYVSPDGRRCDGRAFLELDHAEPRALGGRDTVENLRVRCRAHNQLAAEHSFGREYVEMRKHLRQRKWTVTPTKFSEAPSGCMENDRPNSARVLEKVRFALRRLGFGHAEASRAIAEVAVSADPEAGLEEVFRSALIAATRAA